MRKGYPSKLRRSVVGYASAGFAEDVKMPRAEARGASLIAFQFSECHKKGPCQYRPRARKISFLPTGRQVLRQLGYPKQLGPVAFRPTITRGLALSADIMKIL